MKMITTTFWDLADIHPFEIRSTFNTNSEVLSLFKIQLLTSLFLKGGAGGSGGLNAKGQKIPTEVKSDSVLPAYCNPPNPCPVGYTADDGCLEMFENTAAFSRAYQASQDCMCDQG
jgi:hypothetical protein